MGRKPKTGIDYFPADVDMFQDRKIKRLLRSAGGKGFTVYIYLLTHIYGDNGYFYEWDEHSAFDISDDLNFSENVVEEAVRACIARGLFNEALYDAESILTSESIQERWQKIVTDAKRVDTEINDRYLIVDGKAVFLTEETPLTTEEIQKPPEETPQSKVKESKVNNNSLSNAERARKRKGYSPQQLDPPETVDKVIEIGGMKGIKPEQCENYFYLRSTDNFMRRDKDQNWKPILNWHSDLIHLYRKGALDSKEQKPKTNGGRNGAYGKSKGDIHVDALQSL